MIINWLGYRKRVKVKLLFDEIDADRSGLLDLDEVLQLTKSLGMELSAQGLRVAMAAMDVDGSGEVVRRLIFFQKFKFCVKNKQTFQQDFDEFYQWWTTLLETGLGGGSGISSLFEEKKASFLGGDAELALMMAIANGREAW